jgi:hypothetical protein
MTHSIERQDSATTLELPDENWRTELAARDNHGISVKLFWTRGTDVLTVTVSDAADGEYFELVLDAERTGRSTSFTIRTRMPRPEGSSSTRGRARPK